MTIAEELQARLQAETDRQPHFDPRWPHVADIDFAVEVTLERLEEQEYRGDPHVWCHERPILLALLSALLDDAIIAAKEAGV